jgi:hypothetical protein
MIKFKGFLDCQFLNISQLIISTDSSERVHACLEMGDRSMVKLFKIEQMNPNRGSRAELRCAAGKRSFATVTGKHQQLAAQPEAIHRGLPPASRERRPGAVAGPR